MMGNLHLKKTAKCIIPEYRRNTGSIVCKWQKPWALIQLPLIFFGIFMKLHQVYGIFFFFQAEDGIRDLYVTGVQTCALPISRDAAATWIEGLPQPPLSGA